ncbi:MAG: rRNA pseudouridine synthase [Oscillospiraceae bacterium]|nr:rRNA pseudouridine synthase [Oscillospiraceae bacterium]
MAERIQKLIAEAGVCSRRAAESLIENGRVTVNGAVVALGARADASDRIEIDGKPIGGAEEHVYLMLNKPTGYVTTMRDEKGRPTVAQLVEGCGARVYPVGRLDMDSEGLLLMTNDGVLAQRLLHPRYEKDKTYHVTVAGEVENAAARLAGLTDIDGEAIRPAIVHTLHAGRETATLSITIHEGKNRQIRRMCAALGLHVKRLVRVREHTLALGGLPAGKWRHLTAGELSQILEK